MRDSLKQNVIGSFRTSIKDSLRLVLFKTRIVTRIKKVIGFEIYHSVVTLEGNGGWLLAQSGTPGKEVCLALPRKAGPLAFPLCVGTSGWLRARLRRSRSRRRSRHFVRFFSPPPFPFSAGGAGPSCPTAEHCLVAPVDFCPAAAAPYRRQQQRGGV